MALKFLNKKGWHTGSLRNIENVWKAEQKHEAEQHKLEELRKQIQEERERTEFRLLQEQAGLVPRQERLDFLYESGLAVGKGSSEGFKALQPQAPAAAPTVDASSSKAAVPGALFEDKPQSANDAWRKLHSDPLLLIRQREQEALARIKNNPIKMAVIKKSVEAEKKQKQEKEEKQEKRKHKHHHGKSKNGKHSSKVYSDSEDTSEGEEERMKRDPATSERQEHSKTKHDKRSSRIRSDSESREDEVERRKRGRSMSGHDRHGNSKHDKHTDKIHSHLKNTSGGEEEKRKRDRSISEHHRDSYSKHEKHSSKVYSDSEDTSEGEEERTKRDPATSERQEHSKTKHDKHSSRIRSDSESREDEVERRKRGRSMSGHDRHGNSKHDKHTDKIHSHLKNTSGGEEEKRKRDRSISEHHRDSYSKHEKHSSRGRSDSKYHSEEEGKKNDLAKSERLRHSSGLGIGSKPKETNTQNPQQEPGYGRSRGIPKMSEEERAARLREMQLDAELHEEQRWKRLKRAAEADAQEALRAGSSRGKNFLDVTQKSIYGAENGGSSTIEESVRRRAYYSQGGSAAHESNAFRR